ncbi:hypothetical protein RHMOL_Rhmol01G0308600 [Rhododendron molle]|uniref:Uncharacterized protein n=1 Tax=Rhododendron molle TaxID=49168 RepID=A0ACC0QAV4_RHOML|nr:hypothetical protein RHMOL_Rhmol01G0308600 [Rhododendron molle]
MVPSHIPGKMEKKTKDSILSGRLNNSRDNVVNRGNPHDTKLELPTIDFEEIAAATDNFSISSKIGEGGFGPVFKGKLRDGQEVAVKRLSRCSGQGIEEFKNEIILISKLQHRNLVRFLGCCIEGEEMLIVYEYICPTKGWTLFSLVCSDSSFNFPLSFISYFPAHNVKHPYFGYQETISITSGGWGTVPHQAVFKDLGPYLVVVS